MEKRYQVFVSSTYDDLREERQAVMQALLELDCIPSGMELFPAGDDEQWTLIKKAIDDCDYYIVIIGGRYGSVGVDGKSYTQMEYEYAVSKGKPVAAFLHGEPGNIASSRTDPENREKLEEFRALAKRKTVNFWRSPAELGLVLTSSMVKLMKAKPGVGWVRANLVPDESAAQQILQLRNELDRIQKEVAELMPPKGAEGLAQGDEEISLTFWSVINDTETHLKMPFTWNRLVAALLPILLNKANEDDMRNKVIELFENRLQDEAKSTIYTSLRDEDFQPVKVQLLALGLIKKAGEAGYWTLTPWGTHVMTQVAAIPSISQTPNVRRTPRTGP